MAGPALPSIVVLISGRGSNLRAIVQAQLPCRVAAVISNRHDAAGLAYAREHGIATQVIDHAAFDSREAFDLAMIEAIDAHAPQLIVLAGFMRILSSHFVRHYEGRLINIHPSLLPAYPGLHTHQRALEDGVRVHGCTVHFVTATLDSGPIIIQAAVPVHADDTEETLSGRVLIQEHLLYPQAVRWFVQGRLVIEGARVRVAAQTGHATAGTGAKAGAPAALVWPALD